MSRAFFYTLQGGDKLIDIIRNYPKVVQEAISEQFEISAQEIRSNAVAKVQDRKPGEFDHMGHFKTKIRTNKVTLKSF